MANSMVEGLEEAYGELRSALVLLGMVSVAAGHWQQDVNHSESTECKMVEGALKASRAIEPGMTGRELEEHWRMDGGASVRDQANYTYSQCTYIKVHVKFKVATSIGGSALPPDDTVPEMSRPYLDYPTTD